MMIYDNCVACRNNWHEQCGTDPEAYRFICTCPICNALAFNESLKEHTTLDDIENLCSNMAWHVEKMTPNQINIFKEMMKNEI